MAEAPDSAVSNKTKSDLSGKCSMGKDEMFFAEKQQKSVAIATDFGLVVVKMNSRF